MRRLNRVLVGLVVLLGAIRAALYLVYAAYQIPMPLETFHLEAAMANYAWRAQRGLALYQDENAFPHVSFLFGPLYFAGVGRLARAAARDDGNAHRLADGAGER